MAPRTPSSAMVVRRGVGEGDVGLYLGVLEVIVVFQERVLVAADADPPDGMVAEHLPARLHQVGPGPRRLRAEAEGAQTVAEVGAAGKTQTKGAQERQRYYRNEAQPETAGNR